MKKTVSYTFVFLIISCMLLFSTSYKNANAVDDESKEQNVIWGDVDLDGRLTIRDAATIQKHLVGYISLNDGQLFLADTDASGKVNINDATVIQMYLVDLINILPIEEEMATSESTAPSDNTNPEESTGVNDSTNPTESETNNTTIPQNEVQTVIIKPSTELFVDDEELLEYQVLPANADNKEVSWKSSNDEIVSVDNSGKIIGLSVGQATITCTTSNNKTALCLVTVKERVINPSEDTNYTVVFYDADGLTELKSQTVGNGKAATPPEAPKKDGVEFIGWSGNYFNVTNDESIRAVYSDEKNIIVVKPSDISSSNTVDVLLSLEGTVKTCGFDLNVMYDSNLELINYDDDLDLELVTNTNAYENGVRLNFSGVNDKVKQRDIIMFTFRIKMNSIKEINNNNPVNSTYTIVNAVING